MLRNETFEWFLCDADALTYIQDVCVNLTLILELHPPCGTFLMKGGGQLLACLAHVHDYLLPDLAAALGNLTEDNISNSSADDIMHSARMTFVIIQRLSFIMLKQAYLRTDLDSGGQSLQVGIYAVEMFMHSGYQRAIVQIGAYLTSLL